MAVAIGLQPLVRLLLWLNSSLVLSMFILVVHLKPPRPLGASNYGPLFLKICGKYTSLRSVKTKELAPKVPTYTVLGVSRSIARAEIERPAKPELMGVQLPPPLILLNTPSRPAPA